MEGEVLEYIGLDQARIKAIEYARDNTDFYGPKYEGVYFAWEFKSAEETEDYYEINLSFRPAGRWRGEPGLEQFIFDKTGELRVRQLFDEPIVTSIPEAQSEHVPGTEVDVETELSKQSVEIIPPSQLPVQSTNRLVAGPEKGTEPLERVESGEARPPGSLQTDQDSLDTLIERREGPGKSALDEEYDGSNLPRKKVGVELDSLYQKLEAFEDRVVRLSAVEKELKSLDTSGFSQDYHGLTDILKDPDMVEQVEARLAALKQDINREGNNDTSRAG